MTSSSEQPPYEMQDAYILTKEDWLRLREHLTIGCTNQKVFLDTLRPHPAPAPCPHWKDARNLKSDFRDQIKGDHYCNLEAPCPQHQIWQHCPIAGEIARKAREDVHQEIIKIGKTSDCIRKDKRGEKFMQPVNLIAWCALQNPSGAPNSRQAISMSEQQQEYIITEAVFNHVVAALRDNRQYDVAEYLIAGSRPHTPAPAPVVDILTLLEETVDNWWRTYNNLDFDCYRRTKPKEKGLKHHHNMRTHVYKKYKMFFDYCKTPEGIQRMQEFNRKAKEYITIRSTQQQAGRK